MRSASHSFTSSPPKGKLGMTSAQTLLSHPGIALELDLKDVHFNEFVLIIKLIRNFHRQIIKTLLSAIKIHMST